MPPNVTALLPIHRTDGNRKWLQDAVNSLGPNVTPLVLENDGEVTEALNAGLNNATTEWVLPFGADDLAHPTMVDELERAGWDVDVAYPQMQLVSEDLKETVGFHEAQPFCRNRLLQGNFVTGNSLIRREKALAVGGYRDLESWEDWDLFVRMSGQGDRFKAVPAARMYYRQVSGSRNRQDIDWEALRLKIVGDTDLTADLKASFYYSPTPAVAYLRCVLPARHLPGVARESFDVGYGPDGQHEFFGHRGAAVFQLGSNRTVAILAAQMRQDGMKVLIETDDNYLAGGAKLFRERAGWGQKIGDKANTVQGHRLIVEDANGVIVTTEFLAKQYRRVNPNVYVCPNQVDPDDWQPLAKPEDGVFRVGWFASKSHAGDEKLIRRAMEWCSGQPDVEVVTLGYDPRWDFPYTALPWATDLSAYRQAMQYLNVGLCPVIPTPFSRGRSDLKWLEYSMGGAATVVSDVECYSEVPDALTLKATDAAGFLRQVRQLVQNRDETRDLAVAARDFVLSERTIAGNIWRWQEAVS